MHRAGNLSPRAVSLFQGISYLAPMLYIDSVILNMIEGACRRFQRLTGRTNVWLAVQLTNLSIIVYFVWAAAAFWSENEHQNESTPKDNETSVRNAGDMADPPICRPWV